MYKPKSASSASPTHDTGIMNKNQQISASTAKKSRKSKQAVSQRCELLYTSSPSLLVLLQIPQTLLLIPLPAPFENLPQAAPPSRLWNLLRIRSLLRGSLRRLGNSTLPRGRKRRSQGGVCCAGGVNDASRARSDLECRISCSLSQRLRSPKPDAVSATRGGMVMRPCLKQ